MPVITLVAVVGVIATVDSAAILIVRQWHWLSDGGNAAGIQAISAVAVVLLTAAILTVMRSQAAIVHRQTAIQEQQATVQSSLARLEHAPILVAEFAPGYGVAANGILVRNVGRGPAHNLRGQIWVRGGQGSFIRIPVHPAPANLAHDDAGRADPDPTDLGSARPPFNGMAYTLDDRWVLHYGDTLGGTWHTTSNIDDKGRHSPLGYFRSWSPADWARLHEQTRGLCWVCLQDQDRRAAADQVYGP